MTQLQRVTHKDFFNSPAVKERFAEVLKGKETGFITSLLSLIGDNRSLANANPETVYKAAMKAAVLDLPIEPSLGYAYVVPYKNQAQFQLGYKGLIQLAQRSGKYKSINSGIVYKSQLISYNPLFEELEVDFTQPADEVVGYFAAFKLLNGFEKLTFWTKEQAEAHGKRFSKSYNSGPWKTDFDAMAQKTLLKQIISKYGPLSVEMQEAITSDNENETIETPKDITPVQPETLDDLFGGSELPQKDNKVEMEQSTEEANEAPQTQEKPPKTTRQKKSEVVVQETGEIFEQESLFEGMTTNPKEV
ncbi:recombinase RecT [Streptococcus sp. NLN64]|uniref:recombinase RecT n=1 Tax=Streptococcus sp. NLN64 TaxID=2822799 RepID=UPI0018CA7635|nr:recombinase RecT [Streptococcus sp. NLN64]MBG9366524.1 recombinase RecT [Streptococcus sp. NLN64]